MAKRPGHPSTAPPEERRQPARATAAGRPPGVAAAKTGHPGAAPTEERGRRAAAAADGPRRGDRGAKAGGPPAPDYRQTLHLPKTDFPMRADLPRREPEMQRRWSDQRLYERIREARAGRPRFVLHDGPPYVNGNVHMGTALNKSLKDFIVRFQTMEGMDAPYVPGWDCHGLPVELQALRTYGLDRTRTDPRELRRRCREFALSFLETMTGQFTRLGVIGDWAHPYMTLDPAYEAEEIAVFGRMAARGVIYRGLRPVYWCADCTTALAEAEVAFAEHESPSLTLLFPLRDGRGRLPAGTLAAVWTTTPWTLPANVAITAHPELEYVVVATARGPVLCAEAALERLLALAPEQRAGGGDILGRYRGAELEGVLFGHPFVDRDSPIVLADYVEAAEGTGLVHTAPGHGPEDFEVGRRYGLPVIQPLDDRGVFTEEGGPVAGMSHTAANGRIVEILREGGRLWHAGTVRHEYAHCWRCKNPVIWRATEQWFCDVGAFRAQAVAAARAVRWHPAWGEQRMADMVGTRGDWCLSRQRAWGVPIPVLHCERCGEPLLAPAVFERVAEVVRAEGADAWWARPAADFLPVGAACRCGSREVRKDPDIFDVWFESGTSHAAVLARDPALAWPADLYLEGPDQYRGWFQSSLLTAVATAERAPYRAVATNGWVLDGEGRAMHKSLGNVINPSDLLDRWGADVLRLWVASVDYTADVRVSPEIMAQVGEVYRKLRNTVRFLLGNLADWRPAAGRALALPERDRYILHRLAEVMARARRAYAEYRFNAVHRLVTEFCVAELSNFYLDVAKDRLYCARAEAPERVATRAALYEVARGLVTMIAPILPHTADEAWAHLPKREGDPDSVHLLLWREPPAVEWTDEAAGRWAAVVRLRERVARAVEAEIAGGRLGKAAEAEVLAAVSAEDADLLQPLADELADLLLVAAVRLEAGEPAVAVTPTAAPRCPRCWRHRPPAPGQRLCARCAETLAAR